jgi:hypothetical protein
MWIMWEDSWKVQIRNQRAVGFMMFRAGVTSVYVDGVAVI